MPSDIVVSEALIDAIAIAEEPFCREIRRCNPRDGVIGLIDERRHTFNLIEPFIGKYQRPKILEIGSGNGFGLCYLLKSGLDVVGVEPGSQFSFEGRFERALWLLESNGMTPASSYLSPSSSEDLPFEDSVFDIVFSTAVLEHVSSVESCLREAFRVLKPGGVVIMTAPDYNSAYEGHYDIWWVPYVLAGNKRLAKWYVRTIIGRPDYYIDQLNFTTPRWLKKAVRAASATADVETYHFLQSPLTPISSIHYYLSSGLTSKYKALTWIGKVRWISWIVRWSTGALSRVLAGLALAPMFAIVCHKQPAIGVGSSPSRPTP